MRSTPTRMYSFIVPACVDGMLGLTRIVIPLLALRFGADAQFLGYLYGLPQVVRFPFCLLSGHLSDRVGRAKVIIPALLALLVGCITLAAVRDRWQLLLVSIVLVSAQGAFYPPLQAFIGERSASGELRRNLSAYNLGWTTGAGIMATVAGFIFAVWTGLPSVIGGVLVVGVLLVILSWLRVPVIAVPSVVGVDSAPDSYGSNRLLFMARIGHFTCFFASAAAGTVFPKLGQALHMSEGMIGLALGMATVGASVGMLITSGTWWHGRLWPILAPQTALILLGLTIFFANSAAVVAAAMLLFGIASVIPYTCALYYGLHSRKEMGKNTSIHESLGAVALVLGSLIAGRIGQYISLRAPYAMISALALASILFTLMYWKTSHGAKR